MIIASTSDVSVQINSESQDNLPQVPDRRHDWPLDYLGVGGEHVKSYWHHGTQQSKPRYSDIWCFGVRGFFQGLGAYS